MRIKKCLQKRRGFAEFELELNCSKCGRGGRGHCVAEFSANAVWLKTRV